MSDVLDLRYPIVPDVQRAQLQLSRNNRSASDIHNIRSVQLHVMLEPLQSLNAIMADVQFF